MKRIGAAVAALLLAASPALARHDAADPFAHDCPAPSADPAQSQPLPPLPGLRIGLALGSGSVHGLAHVGAIEALEARGVDVRVVAGTSAGAIVGSLWASGLEATAIEAFAKSADLERLGEFAPSWQGLRTNEELRRRLADAFGGRAIESWPRRFGAVATDLDDGTRRLLASGDGALAVQASTAMPVYFTPVRLGGRRLGDGALVEPVPVATARELGADYVIAIDVAYRPYEEPASGLVQNGLQAMHILVNALAAAELRDADFPIRLDLHKTMTDCGPESLVGAGREAIASRWPELRRSLLAARAVRPRATGRP